jgi:predicted small lipoprotein YifL
MNRVRLVSLALVAVLPLAGCGNKGPLILAPQPQGNPPPMPAATQPAAADTFGLPSATTVVPPSGSTIFPPSATTVPVPTETHGTPGTPR